MSEFIDLESALAAAAMDAEAALFAVVDGIVKPRALELIPRDTNTAANSVTVTMSSPDPLGFTCTLGFGRDDDSNPKSGQSSNTYVVPLHERMDMEHPNGGQAKFLEQAVTETQPTFGALIVAKMKR